MPNQLKSWLPVAANSDFSIYNIPFGVYQSKNNGPRACSAIGDYVIDLYELAKENLIDAPIAVLDKVELNDFIALGKSTTSLVRNQLQALFTEEVSVLKANESLQARVLI